MKELEHQFNTNLIYFFFFLKTKVKCSFQVILRSLIKILKLKKKKIHLIKNKTKLYNYFKNSNLFIITFNIDIYIYAKIIITIINCYNHNNKLLFLLYKHLPNQFWSHSDFPNNSFPNKL